MNANMREFAIVWRVSVAGMIVCFAGCGSEPSDAETAGSAIGGGGLIVNHDSRYVAVGAFMATRRVTSGRPASHCAGTLISPRVVVTARHCFASASTINDAQGFPAIQTEEMVWATGDLRSPTYMGLVESLELETEHPRKTDDAAQSDVALVFLRDAAPMQPMPWTRPRSADYFNWAIVSYGDPYRTDRQTISMQPVSPALYRRPRSFPNGPLEGYQWLFHVPSWDKGMTQNGDSGGALLNMPYSESGTQPTIYGVNYGKYGPDSGANVFSVFGPSAEAMILRAIQWDTTTPRKATCSNLAQVGSTIAESKDVGSSGSHIGITSVGGWYGPTIKPLAPLDGTYVITAANTVPWRPVGQLQYRETLRISKGGTAFDIVADDKNLSTSGAMLADRGSLSDGFGTASGTFSSMGIPGVYREDQSCPNFPHDYRYYYIEQVDEDTLVFDFLLDNSYGLSSNVPPYSAFPRTREYVFKRVKDAQ